MDPFHLGYSAKNIPVQGKMEYLKDLTHNIESFVKRVRWKALICLEEIVRIIRFGLRSRQHLFSKGVIMYC